MAHLIHLVKSDQEWDRNVSHEDNPFEAIYISNMLLLTGPGSLSICSPVSYIILRNCILFWLNSCGQDFKKLNESEVDSKKVQIAIKFADDFLTKLKNGSYYKFGNEAVDVMKNQLTEAYQKTLYQQLKNQFGEFQRLDYAETWIQTANPAIKIYRFKGDFDKSNKKLEIRVVLNESAKIAGFWIKPWSDMLK